MLFNPAQKCPSFIMKKLFCLLIVYAFAVNPIMAGLNIVKSNGISVSGVDGVSVSGVDGISVSGVDNFLTYKANGISVSGTDGVTVSGTDGVTVSGADGVTYIKDSGVTVSGADGITVSGADGVTVSGVDGVTVSGVDGQTYTADSIVFKTPNGITVSGADGITVSGVDGVTVTGTDGVTVSGADGITVSGTDGLSIADAYSATGFDANGVVFHLALPTSLTVSRTDGVSVSGADGITISGADGITVSGVDDQNNQSSGLQSVDPELALLLNQLTDDSNVNAVIVYHQQPTQADFTQLQQLGILGGTKFNNLPFVIVTGTRSQIIAVSQLQSVRSIYGNRTLSIDSDPYFKKTGVQRVIPDVDLQSHNSGMPVSGQGVTVAVLDTGVNALHNDLNSKVVQNVQLLDLQSIPVGFQNPIPLEGLPNTDLIAGHGTFVAGVIAANGLSSGGKYNGVAPGANILGLSAGSLALLNILSGFDYILSNKLAYNIRVVNCSFSANTVYDVNDPVNIATKLLTENGVNVVFSAGNTGSGNGTMNPYAMAPWVISVGASDQNSKLADFSSRGNFGSSGPTLVAPGVNIVSLRSLLTTTSILGILGGDAQRLTPGEIPFYTTASGTSFSAPQVSGAIALMLNANPNLTPAEIKDILSRTSTPLPNYYRHEVGAGMLNTYAAVLESAFPQRKMGYFRSVLDTNTVKYTTEISGIFNNTVNQNSYVSNSFVIPENTIQAGINIAWNNGLNDLSLKLYNSNNNLVAESNYLNLLGLTGKREKINLNNPSSQTYTAKVQHTLNIGTPQEFFGAVETTRLEVLPLNDISNLSITDQNLIKESLSSFVMTPIGNRFRPDFKVTRAELAEAFVRSGNVPQYMAGSILFPDVRDLSTRNAVESAQNNPDGKLFYDATTGNNFNPNSNASKLVATVAFVIASDLDTPQNLALSIMPLTCFDTYKIPSQYRPYVALAINKGLIKLDGNKFNPDRSLTRLEMTKALVKLKNLAQ